MRHVETDRAEKEGKQRPFGLVVSWRKTESWSKSAIRPYCVWVPERAKHKEILSHFERCSPCEEIERNKLRVWVSEKEKWDIFSLLKLHTRKINWWSSHGVFGYNYGELQHSEEDFTTGFVVRLYLLIEIYLLYIQFIVNTSCNLYFIVDIFRSCPMVFPSTLEGFPHKIWCSCVIVFMWCLLESFFCFHNIAIAW